MSSMQASSSSWKTGGGVLLVLNMILKFSLKRKIGHCQLSGACISCGTMELLKFAGQVTSNYQFLLDVAHESYRHTCIQWRKSDYMYHSL